MRVMVWPIDVEAMVQPASVIPRIKPATSGVAP
jgi:hypothetical protein